MLHLGLEAIEASSASSSSARASPAAGKIPDGVVFDVEYQREGAGKWIGGGKTEKDRVSIVLHKLSPGGGEGQEGGGGTNKGGG